MSKISQKPFKITTLQAAYSLHTIEKWKSEIRLTFKSTLNKEAQSQSPQQLQ